MNPTRLDELARLITHDDVRALLVRAGVVPRRLENVLAKVARELRLEAEERRREREIPSEVCAVCGGAADTGCDACCRNVCSGCASNVDGETRCPECPAPAF